MNKLTIVSLIAICPIIITCTRETAKITPFQVAYQIAQSPVDEYERARLLQFIVLQHAEHGEYDSAVAIVRDITDTDAQSQSLYSIVAICLEDQDYEKALEITELISAPYNRAFALHIIASTYAKNSELEKAETLSKQSLEVARTIDDKVQQIRMLLFLVDSYVLYEMREEAVMILEEAHQILSEVPDTTSAIWFADITIDLAGAYIDIEEQAMAQMLLQKAESLATSMGRSHFQDMRMADIAHQYARAGKYKKARDVAESITDMQRQSLALFYITEEYVKQDDLEHAVQLAMTIKEPVYQGMAIQGLVEKYFEQGRYDDARSVINMIEDPATEVRVLCWLANKYLKNEQDDEASRVLEQAHILLDAADNNPDKAYALVSVAFTYSKMKHLGNALDALQRAREIALTIQDDHHRSLVLSSIARGFADIKQWHKALETTQMIVSEYLIVTSLLHIQDKYAETGEKIDEKAQQILYAISNDIE